MEIRAARPADAAPIADIYNVGIRERTSTLETREREPAEIAERLGSERHPFLVAELDGRVGGWAAASEYSGRDVYAGVAECSVYVHPELRGRGVGTALLDATNEPSIRLMERGGFRVVGTHERHGVLDGEWRDVILVERSLQPLPPGLAGQPTME